MLATVYVYNFGEDTPSEILVGDNLFKALRTKWQSMPEGAKIYYGKDINSSLEVPLFNEETARHAGESVGEFTVILFPNTGIEIIAIVLGVLAIAAAFLLTPKVPNVATNGQGAESPNGKLGERENQARIGGMIPEIFGIVRATPDLIMQTYYRFINSTKVEYSYMCLGVGYYDFDANDIFEDTTPIYSINDISIECYNPYQSPLNMDSTPFATLGGARYCRDTLWSVSKHGSAIGQKLLPPNTTIDFPVSGSGIQCVYEGGQKIIRESSSSINWDELVFAGETLTIGNVGSPYNGTYTVSSVVANDIILSGGSAWTTSSSTNVDMLFTVTGGTRWTDWMVFDNEHQTMIYINAVAPNGLYKNGSTSREAVSVQLAVEFDILDSTGAIKTYVNTSSATVSYPTISKTFTVFGSYTTSAQRAATMRANIYHVWLDPEQTGVHALSSSSDMSIIREGILHVFTENVDPSLFYRITKFYTNDTTSGSPRYDLIEVSSSSTKYGTPTVWGKYLYNTSTRVTLTFTISGSTRKVTDLLSPYTDFTGIFQVGDMIKIVGITDNRFDVADLTITAFESTGGGTNNRMVVSGASWSSSLNNESAGVYIWYGRFTPNSNKRPTWVTVVNNSDETQKIHMLIDYTKIRTTTENSSGVITAISNSTSTGRPINADPSTNNEKFVLNECIHTGGGQRMRMRIKRNTTKDYNDTSLVDEVVLDSVFGMTAVTDSRFHFGNVTTIHVETKETPQPTSLKKRKLNVLAERKIRCRNADGDYINADGTVATGTAPYLPTRRLDHILSYILTNDKLAGYPSTTIDYANIYETCQAIATYFAGEDITTTGSGYPLNPSATQFNHTFDKDGMSAEEMIQTLCAAWFLTPYRIGSTVKVAFEGQESVSTILFNHRNKVPYSEKRTVSFGNKDNYDGIELDWVNPDNNDTIEKYIIPYTGTATNPYKVEVVGIRSRWHAFLHAWRAWNKIRLQNTTVEFEALPEANTLVKGDVILVSDNTRPETMDGEVVSMSGSVLRLSQPCNIADVEDPNIFLQLPSGRVESIPITQASDTRYVNVTSLPSETLITDDDAFGKTTFQIIGSSQARSDRFIVSSRSSSDNFKCNVQAVNYDEAYYLSDITRWWFAPIEKSWKEKSPFLRHLAPVGATIVEDATRGFVYYQSSQSSYAKTIGTTLLTLPQDYSISAWIKVNHVTSTTRELNIVVSKDLAFKFQVRQSGTTYYLRASYTSGTEQYGEHAFSSPPSSWTHVAMTYKKNPYSVFQGIFKLYINGKHVDTRTLVDHHIGNSLSIAGTGTNGFQGYLDDIRIFKNTISNISVSRLYTTTISTPKR